MISRRIFARLRPLAALSAALCAAATARAQSDAAPAPMRTWEAKVHPALRQAPADAEQDVLIVLAPADLSGAAALTTKADKGRYVYERLTETARQSQGPLLAELDARGIAHQSFWVTNMVLARGKRDLVEALARRSEVLRIEPNPAVAARLPLPDGVDGARTLESAQAVESGPEWNLTKVGAPSVWAAGTTGEGAVVAGADTGYQWTHPALKGKYRGWNGTTANHNYNWHDAVHDAGSGNACGSNTTAPCDDDTHGTHTMGIMVGDDGAGNQVGMAPGAKWIGCRNMDQGTGTPARYTECFQWFLAPTDSSGNNPDPTQAPDVINNSWDCPPSEGCTNPDTLKSVIESVRAAGIAVVVAGGNAGPDCGTMDVPEQYAASWSVGATDDADAIADYSSRGPGEGGIVKPDVAAPGSSIRSSVPGGGYASMSGTSMAAPHAAGLVALMISASPGLDGDVDSLEAIAKATAVPLPTGETCGGVDAGVVPNNASGSGRIDALTAFDAAQCPPPTPVIAAPDSVAPATAGVSASVAAHPVHVYVWTVAGGTLTGGQDTSQITFSSGSAGTLVKLSVSDAIGGCPSTGSRQVLVDFSDVPPTHPFHAAVVKIARNGVSTGCGGGNYCPDEPANRAAMAVFLLKGKHGSEYRPPPAKGTIFTDVPPGAFLGDWIEELAAEGITSGCGGGNFCPNDPVNRAAMSVFLLKGKHGSAYRPPPATGDVFTDVPPGAFLGNWIEQLAAEGITAGCGGGDFCPDGTVTRGEVAAFLSRAFSLP